jgi:hypothetical protein
MIREVIINGRVFVEQVTYFIYEDEAMRSVDKPYLTTSNESLFLSQKRKLLLDFLKEKFKVFVSQYNITVKCGYDKTADTYLIKISPDEQYENNSKIGELMIEVHNKFTEEGNQMITFVCDEGNLEFDEVFFEMNP